MPAAKAASKRSVTARTGGSFRGWSVAAVEFFEQIELDNTKSFWTAHKDTYQSSVLAPMEALLADLAPQFGPGRVLRPYRDTRFSADKSPYKTNIAAHNDGGYLSLSARAFGVGAGLYLASPDQLARYRSAVDDERTGEALSTLVSALRKKGIDVMAHDVLKSAPRGFHADHPRIELLRLKGLAAWRDWPVGPWLGTAAVKKRVVQFFTDAKPLLAWVEKHVGTSDAE